MMSMPITPSACAVAYDSRRVSIGEPTPRDIGILNSQQATFCKKAIYSSKQLSGAELESARHLVEKRQPAPGFIEDDCLHFNTIKLKPFQFITLH